MPRDHLGEVGHRSVGELNGVSVEGPVENMAWWKAGVQDRKETLADLGLDRSTEGGIKPNHLPPPLPLLWSAHLLRGLVAELLGVAGPPQRLLLGTLGVVKDFLGGR